MHTFIINDIIILNPVMPVIHLVLGTIITVAVCAGTNPSARCTMDCKQSQTCTCARSYKKD